MAAGQIQTFYYMAWRVVDDKRKAKIAEDKKKKLDEKRKAAEEKQRRVMGGRGTPLRRRLVERGKPSIPDIPPDVLRRLADEMD